MKILAIADVEQSWLTTGFDPERLRGVNMIISCGDLPARYLEHVVTMANLPLLYVPGNHATAYRAHAPEGCDSIDGRIREVAGHPPRALPGPVLMCNKKWSEGTAVGILDQIHPMRLAPNPFGTAWGSCNPGRS